MSVWRERMRAHADAAYVHVIVNEGKEAGASLPHTHAQLYALPFVPAAVARERERFTAYSDRTQGRNLLEDLVQEEVRRRERIVAIDDEAVALCPFAARVPFHMQLVPRRPAARFSDDGPLGARLLHEVLTRLRAALGALPPLNMWVRTAPRDAEQLLLAHRGDAAPRPARRARDRHRRAPERARAGGRGAAAARREPVASPPPCRPSATPGPDVRGRAARRSRCPTGAGARRSASSSLRGRRRDRGRGGDISLVPGPHLGRPHLRAGHGAGRTGGEVFGYVSYTREHEGAQAADFQASCRLHRGDRRREPRLDARPLRRGDRPVARHRGPARGDHARVGRGAGAERRRWPPPSSGRRRPTSASWWTTASRSSRSTPTPATTSRSRLFGARGAELARESLYEDE